MSTSPASLSVAVIGAGMAGTTHANAWRQVGTVFELGLPKVRLAAIADAYERCLRTWATRLPECRETSRSWLRPPARTATRRGSVEGVKVSLMLTPQIWSGAGAVMPRVGRERVGPKSSRSSMSRPTTRDRRRTPSRISTGSG